MNFIWSKLIQSVVKKGIAAAVAFMSGPQVAVFLARFGVKIDLIVLSTGLFTAWETLRGWLTHQPWTPNWLKKVL